MKKIIITGIGDTRNNGCWAMIVSAISMIQKLSPVPIKFIVLTRKTSKDRNRLKNLDVEFIVRPWTKVTIPKLTFIWTFICFFLLPLQALIFRVLKKKTSANQFWRHCLESDLFLDLSGDSFSSDYNNFSLVTLTIPILIAKLLNKPYMFCAQSIGPFSNTILHKIILILLKDASSITTRERITDNILAQYSICSNVISTHDLAFSLVPANDERIRAICQKEQIDPSLPWTGVSVSDLIINYSFKDLLLKDRRTVLVQAMADFFDCIVMKYNKYILFIPHVVIPEISDDRQIMFEIYNSMQYRNKAVIVHGNYLGSELKGLIGLCEFFIGSRMHATIAALSQCIPAMTYVYNHKTIGINGNILGQKEYLIDLRAIKGEELSYKSKSIFAKLLSNAFEIKEELKQRLPEIRVLSQKNGNIAVGLLEVAGPLRFMNDPKLCTGCGACAAVCPSGILKLQKTPEGTLRPRLNGVCSECFKCLRVCPIFGIDIGKLEFQNGNKRKYASEIGIVLNSFKGYSCDPVLRKKSSSGGLVTEIARYLIETELVDAVLVVGNNNKDPLLPKPVWAMDEHTLIQSTGSKYLPVPLLEAFRNIPEYARRLAVVGLPCHLWGLWKLENKKYLNGREIVLKIGLFCGRTPRRDAIDFITEKLNTSSDKLLGVKFRGDGWPGDVCFTTQNKEFRLALDEVWVVMGSPYFTPRHCFFCPDQFSHLADLSFGDAWLPEHRDDNDGWSICIARSDRGLSLLKELSEKKRIYLENIPIKKIKKAFLGNIKRKYREKHLKSKFLAVRHGVHTKDSINMEMSLKKQIGVWFDYLLCNCGSSKVFQERMLTFPENSFMKLSRRIIKILLNR